MGAAGREGGPAPTGRASGTRRIGELAGRGAVWEVISALDDPDVAVRGEAFAALVSEEADISERLARALGSPSRNVRGFCALVLANRGDGGRAGELAALASGDPSSMVRSCALGALGYLRASGPAASAAVRGGFADPNVETRRSALKAALDMGVALSPSDVEALSAGGDGELLRMLESARRA